MTQQLESSLPKSRLELHRWLFFEPGILNRSTSLNWKNKKQISGELLKSFSGIALISVIIWGIINLLITLVDLPLNFPHCFESTFIEAWKYQPGQGAAFQFLLTQTVDSLIYGLIIALAMGQLLGFVLKGSRALPGGLALQAAISLSLGFVIGLDFTADIGQTFGLAGGAVFGFVFGSVLGHAFGLSFGINLGIKPGWLIGIIGCAVVALVLPFHYSPPGQIEYHIALGGSAVAGWLLWYFRILPFYLRHLIRCLFPFSLDKNPYMNDGVIWAPILGVKHRLVKQAKEDPEKADELVDFLLKYRPLQKTLALRVSHAATAGAWLQNNFSGHILNKTPVVRDDRPALKPSDQWFQKLAAIRQELVSLERQQNIPLKLKQFDGYIKHLKEFQDSTRSSESSTWNRYYFDTIDRWIQSVEEDKNQIKTQASHREPITGNLFKSDGPLEPGLDNDIFVGREELVQELKNKMLSSPNMPIFLMYGQAKTGKTSLIRFLPYMLGTGFKVVYVDMHTIETVYQWLSEIQKSLESTLFIDTSPLPPSLENDWLQAWTSIRNILEETAHKDKTKILMVFDGYEVLHPLFKNTPGKAGELLSAIRSFSMFQDQVSFLFVGEALFSELTEPHWSNSFVQVVRLKVDYLTEETFHRLPPVVSLEYTPEVLAEIYQLTAGHPQLIQKILHEMVNTANRSNRNRMTAEDLDNILEDHIYVADNIIIGSFWNRFCNLGSKSGAMKTTVRQIIAGETPGDFRAAFRLAQHGYTIKDNQGVRMRVPIFEEWICRFGK